MKKYFLVLLLSFVNLVALASHEGQSQNQVEQRKFSPTVQVDDKIDTALTVKSDIEHECSRFHGHGPCQRYLDRKEELDEQWMALLAIASLSDKWNNEKSLTAAQ